MQGLKDLIDVRLKILRYTNPLRAKILIFSIIYHPFKFSTRDWLTLKMQDLDNLIHHLYSSCPTPTELEEKLHQTARKLNDSEEELTTASVIFKAMKPLYSNLALDNANEAISSNEREITPESDKANLVSSLDEDDRSNSHLDNDETQLLDLDKNNSAFNGKPRESFILSNVETQNDEKPDADDDLTQPLFIDLEYLDEARESISYNPDRLNSSYADGSLPKLSDFDRSRDLENLSESRSSEAGNSSSGSRLFAIADNNRGNITASFLRKIDLEDDMQRLIDGQAQKVRESLVEAVRYIEEEFDRISINIAPNDRISTKYPALQQLTDRLSAHLSQIQNILKVQAKAAIAAPPPPSLTSPNFQPKTSHATPQAIVALLNPILKPQGIKTLVKQKEGCLHIVLEFYGAATLQDSGTLNPQKLTTIVRTALLDINLEAIDRIKVYGRKPGSQSPEWIQIVPMSQ